ncbi:MAG: hypothetical protein AAF443_07940, partial [Chlamydiota bacterium]
LSRSKSLKYFSYPTSHVNTKNLTGRLLDAFMEDFRDPKASRGGGHKKKNLTPLTSKNQQRSIF